MGNSDHPEGRRFPHLLGILVLLSTIYLALAGPLVGLNARGVISDSTWDTMCNTVYAPLVWLDRETDFFATPPGEAYLWYVQLFEP